MDRRDFLRKLGLSLAAGWVLGRLSGPATAAAAGPELRLAFLSDAHLKSGEARLPAARALARAVAEINALAPPPDVVLFAGDLAHQGRPDALDLGREILSDLPAPLWAVRGEGDCGRAGITSWIRRFGSPRFSRNLGGVHFLGLNSVPRRAPGGPVFELGAEQRGWLTRQLAGIDPATPLVILSHAPLARLFLPWQQWTGDAPELAPHLARFRRVVCLHGHVHGAGLRKANDWPGSLLTAPQKFNLDHGLHLSLPATAWPLPAAVLGTPSVMRPGRAPHGCGWALLSLRAGAAEVQPHLWQV